ncbi:hypothetical protein SAMN05444368_0909 [Acetomicrobium flavidum]|uniref:Terminase small subunit n=1 Tax=Acetomicrobium flavidum TaxID=49896 RepID=A0ABY1JCS1_9BACT|nr:hypothetical protein SAMN05444368_0909 [Acetomicrobium flavidum]
MKEEQEFINDIQELKTRMVNAQELANLLACTTQYIYLLAKQGILVKEGPSQFPLAENIQKYLQYLLKSEKGSDKVLYWSEKAKHERALRQMSELKLEQLDNKLHDAKAVEVVMNDMMSYFRKRTLAIADETPSKLVGIKNPAEICDILTDAVKEALSDMSNYKFHGEV